MQCNLWNEPNLDQLKHRGPINWFPSGHQGPFCLISQVLIGIQLCQCLCNPRARFTSGSPRVKIGHRQTLGLWPRVCLQKIPRAFNLALGQNSPGYPLGFSTDCPIRVNPRLRYSYWDLADASPQTREQRSVERG